MKTTGSGHLIRLNKQTLVPHPGKNYAEVILWGDTHWGSPECDREKAKAMLDYCLQKKMYLFCMGDLIESATRYSVGAGVYEQGLTPQEQIDEMLEMLRPHAEAGLVIGFLQGNHEFRVYKESGVNVSKAMARELRVPFLGDAGWSYFKVGSEHYTLYTLHGASGSRYVYTKLKSLVDISHSFNADLIAQGHVHSCADTSQLVQYVHRSSGVVREFKKFLVLTGHYLSYDRSYAQAKGLPIEKLGSPKVKFYADHHDIHISW